VLNLKDPHLLEYMDLLFHKPLNCNIMKSKVAYLNVKRGLQELLCSYMFLNIRKGSVNLVCQGLGPAAHELHRITRYLIRTHTPPVLVAVSQRRLVSTLLQVHLVIRKGYVSVRPSPLNLQYSYFSSQENETETRRNKTACARSRTRTI
jgi:hypothetical protein